MRLGSLAKAREDFQKVSDGARDPRTGVLMAERIVRYAEETIRGSDAMVEKLRLKNITLKTAVKKLAAQLAEKVNH